jgi:hypothetical protein
MRYGGNELKIIVASAAMLLLLYLTLTFPVFGIHSHACICDLCLEAGEADRMSYYMTGGGK